jgi:hypothetical protein
MPKDLSWFLIARKMQFLFICDIADYRLRVLPATEASWPDCSGSSLFPRLREDIASQAAVSPHQSHGYE